MYILMRLYFNHSFVFEVGYTYMHMIIKLQALTSGRSQQWRRKASFVIQNSETNTVLRETDSSAIDVTVNSPLRYDNL